MMVVVLCLVAGHGVFRRNGCKSGLYIYIYDLCSSMTMKFVGILETKKTFLYFCFCCFQSDGNGIMEDGRWI